MGALRAAECAAFGMVGVGRIFELYDSGVIDADDEVALTYDPDTLTALSEPMINIRLAMAHAVRISAVGPSTADAAVTAAKRLYFPERSYYNVGRLLRGAVSDDEHHSYLRYVNGPDRLDQKRQDALALLQTMNWKREACGSD